MQVVKWVGVGLVCAGLGTVSGRASDAVSQSRGVEASANVSESVGAKTGNSVDADNTAKNKRDRDEATLTPADQGHSKSDREMTAKIRRAVVKNDQLSVTAKNIKIITVDGKVTLRGPVKTTEERSVIDNIVKEAKPTSIDNQLEVETAKR